jgi:hypothetical protein
VTGTFKSKDNCACASKGYLLLAGFCFMARTQKETALFGDVSRSSVGCLATNSSYHVPDFVLYEREMQDCSGDAEMLDCCSRLLGREKRSLRSGTR